MNQETNQVCVLLGLFMCENGDDTITITIAIAIIIIIGGSHVVSYYRDIHTKNCENEVSPVLLIC